MSQKLLLFSDGGARGNPGPSAIAFLAQNEKGETIKEDTRYIGIHTNNQAEYEALLLALSYAVDANAAQVTCYLDSELVTKQLNGEYAVKDNILQVYWRKVRELKMCFKTVDFYSVRRSHPQIQRADELVNRTLDEQAKLKSHGSPLTAESSERTTMLLHVSIRTSNMDRSIEFYKKFFGLELLSRREIKQTNSEIAFLQDQAQKGCKLELTFCRNQTKFNQPDYEDRLFDHLGFEVDDINRTVAAMKAEGITVTDEPYKFGLNTTIAFIEDPDGTLIELVMHK